MAENIIAFYHRRLAEERSALKAAPNASVRAIHKQFIDHYDELLRLERFGVDTANRPPGQLGDGWEPLCRFLNVPVPAGPFPRTNDRGEFWDRVSGKK